MKKIFLPAVLAAILFLSCKKDKDKTVPPPQQEPTPLIASIKKTIGNGNSFDLTKTFVYNGENRLKEIKYGGANGGNITEKYSYTGKWVQYRLFTGTTEVPSSSLDYTLNNGGWVENWINPATNSISANCDYNNAGYLARQNYIQNGNTTTYDTYHYSGNNVLDSISRFSANGSKTSVIVFTYETGKRNTIGNENKGLKILGKDQAVPVKSKTVFSYVGSSRRMSSQYDHAYIFGSNDRIVKSANTQTNYTNGVPGQPFISEELEYIYKQQ